MADKKANRKNGKRAYSGVSSTTIDTKTKIIKLENTKEEEHKEMHYYCPECGRKYEIFDKFWIQCDNCKEWYHGDCVYVQPHQEISLDKFHCRRCESLVGPSTFKEVTNQHRHNIYEEDPSDKVQSGTTVFLEKLKNYVTPFADLILVKLHGNQLTPSYLIKHGFNKPILVEEKTGLDIVIPGESFDIEEIIKVIGGYTELDVIDSKRQLSIKMPLVEFARCINNDRREQTLNCISLEVSKTKLGPRVKPPGIVSKLSWVENGWPDCEMKPNVSKYCLMSMKDSYTDFHIDFGGTSVWYHILKGEKAFYLIEPSPANLIKYEEWMARSDQSEIFLPTILDNPSDCKCLLLSQGQTLFIPTGWIHAVLTISDSIVFGGNFLHSLNIKLQLEVYELESRLRTADKFMFPYFELTNWYAVPLICKLLQDNFTKKPPPPEMIEGVESLLNYLKKWNLLSKEENSFKNGDYSPYAPRGCLNTTKLMKDLQKSLKTCLARFSDIETKTKEICISLN